MLLGDGVQDSAMAEPMPQHGQGIGTDELAGQ